MDATELKLMREYLDVKPVLCIGIDTTERTMVAQVFEPVKYDELFSHDLEPADVAVLLPRADRLYINDESWDDLSADEINAALTEMGVDYTFTHR